jgi:hypothetical protein
MKKQYFYEFNGRVLVEANNQDEAEKLATGIPLVDFLVDEDLYEIDENYIPLDLKMRYEKLNTYLHPLDNSEEYEEFRKRVRRYGYVLKKFLHGKINKGELIKHLDQADKRKIDKRNLFYEVQMIPLDTKQEKKARLVPVD